MDYHRLSCFFFHDHIANSYDFLIFLGILHFQMHSDAQSLVLDLTNNNILLVVYCRGSLVGGNERWPLCNGIIKIYQKNIIIHSKVIDIEVMNII